MILLSMDLVRGLRPIVIIIITTVVIIITSTTSSSSSSTSSDHLYAESEKLKKEITCQSKYFQPKCLDHDEVLVVERARYGRMEMSRCVKENFGFIGCSNDVIEVLDSQCSGKRECSIRVLDENFYRRRPCHEDLKSYLAVEYRCIKVIPWNRFCSFQSSITLNLTRGFISSHSTPASPCTSPISPSTSSSLILVAKKGQHFKLFLLDFSPNQEIKVTGVSKSPDKSEVDCQIYGHVIELEEEQSDNGGRVPAAPLCVGGPRMKSILVSKSHALEVQILLPSLFRVNNPSFLIAFQVVGCPDVIPPIGGWNQRNADVLLVGCSKTPETWFMHCSDLEWVGEGGNCTTSWGLLQGVQKDRPSYFFPGAALISFMTFCVGIVIVFIGASVLKRRWRWWSEMLTLTPGANIYDPKLRPNPGHAINQHSFVSYGISGNSDDGLHTTGNREKNNILHKMSQYQQHHHHHHHHLHDHHQKHQLGHHHHPCDLNSSYPPKSCCSCDTSLLLQKTKKHTSGHVVIELVQNSIRKSSVSLSSVKNDVKQIYLL